MKKLMLFVVGSLHLIMLYVAAIACLIIPWITDYDNIANITTGLSVFFLGLGLFFMLMNGFFTADQFDNKFKNKMLSDPELDDEIFTTFIPGSLIIQYRYCRAALYAANMVMPKHRNKIYFLKKWFNNYDFRKDARWIDKLLSYGFVYSFFAVLAGLGLIVVMHLYVYLT